MAARRAPAEQAQVLAVRPVLVRVEQARALAAEPAVVPVAAVAEANSRTR